MQAEDIKQLIEAGLGNSQAIVTGEDGVHFSAIVISDHFLDKSRIQKQQMVYATLRPHVANGTIHALSIKTFTADEWQVTNKSDL